MGSLILPVLVLADRGLPIIARVTMDQRELAAEAQARAGQRHAQGTDSLRVSIVLPAYNEEANIEKALQEAAAAAGRLFADHEIIVVDDGSRDATAALVEGLATLDQRVRLISRGRNRGYGEALRTGFLASRLDYIFFTDADLQFDMDEIERLLPYAGTVDVVAGYRLNRRDARARRL